MVEKLSVAEYDKLSPEEQKAHDAAMAEQEAAEQAGTRDIPPYFVTLELISRLPKLCLISGDRHCRT